MATVLEKCIAEVYRSVVRLFWAGEGKRLTSKDVHKEMFPVYGGKCFVV
jgi:hypothetical protein